ncbi:hypothetical protein SAMN05216417_10995 [Nitrosospira multiformis]|uniref:Uncharacterized protein n=1 Tax=Nitrosospira multiformis TaxID=1231 RepID=A0A1I7HIL3_9PROT|nr:hypothetical protein SAMN05216417_10995 [Nitrosospira multiformis]
MNLQANRDISRKLKVFQHGSESGNVAFTCRYFGISRERAGLVTGLKMSV